MNDGIQGVDTDANDAPVATDVTPETPPKKRRGGATTAAGREASKANSTRHGLTSETVFPPDLLAEIGVCTTELILQFQPGTAYEHWLVGEMGKATAKINRVKSLEQTDIVRVCDRATHFWDADQNAPVEALGLLLPRDTSRVAGELGRTRHGVEWCLKRWRWLGQSLESKGRWTEPQRESAFDLLGIPELYREGCTDVPEPDDLDGLKALVKAQVAHLEWKLEAGLREFDRLEQAAAIAGVKYSEDAETKKLRRYATASGRAFKWAHKELLRVRAEGVSPSSSSSSSPGDMPAPTARPETPDAAQDYLVARHGRVLIPAPDRGGPGPGDEPEAEADEIPKDLLAFLREDRRRRAEAEAAEEQAELPPRPSFAASMSI